jgi:hypothetical protein
LLIKFDQQSSQINGCRLTLLVPPLCQWPKEIRKVI